MTSTACAADRSPYYIYIYIYVCIYLYIYIHTYIHMHARIPKKKWYKCILCIYIYAPGVVRCTTCLRPRERGDSDPFRIEKGVPQGDPLSPLLFNLFLESLSRQLEADPALHGVSALGVTIRKLLYADDTVVLADAPAQLQQALFLIHGWCAAWGMEVSTAAQGRGRRKQSRSPAVRATSKHVPSLPYCAAPRLYYGSRSTGTWATFYGMTWTRTP